MGNESRHSQFRFDISEYKNSEHSGDDSNPYNYSANNDHSGRLDGLIPLDRISIEALLNTLIELNIISHQQLSDCEKRRYGWQAPLPEQQTEPQAWPPEEREGQHPARPSVEEGRIVWTHSNRQPEQVRFKFLRKLLSRFRWSRKLASTLFGWKWRRKGGHNGFGSFE